MEAVAVFEQHRNQYYGGINARFGSFPSRDFRGVNCRSFQSGAGILPTPSKDSTSETKHFYPSSPKTPLTCLSSNSGNAKSGATVPTAPIPIKPKFLNNSVLHEEFYDPSFSFSELWAGPTYSNSPPPSSLPIPKFSVAKRTTSLEIPRSAPEFDLHHPSAKSAPSSPTRDQNFSPIFFFHNDVSATKTLRRILHLDVDNE